MAGRGSLAGLLAYGDANGIVVEMAAEVLPVVKDTPVLAGVNGTDPFRLMPVFLKHLKEMGFDGVQNFPTVGLIDGDFRKNLEATGMGYDKEIEAIRIASEIGLFCSPYVFTPDDARQMARAGADQLVAHVGLTTAGSIGAGVAFTLDDAIERVMAIAAAGRSVRSDIIVICHGGPFDEPEQVEELKRLAVAR
jgi:predicted TIM-barrel enzyme